MVDDEHLDTLRCDTYLHAWEEVDSLHWWDYGAPNIEPMTLRCMRCLKERRDVVNMATDQLVSRRYINGPGHVKYKKGERPSRADFRRQLLSQRIQERRDARQEVTA